MIMKAEFKTVEYKRTKFKWIRKNRYIWIQIRKLLIKIKY